MLDLEGKSILLMDDDERFRKRLERAMTVRGLRVFAAEGVLEALEILETNSLDFAVLDLCVQDGSGLDVVKELGKQQSKTRSVVLTGFGTIATAVEATKLGAVQYLSKPCNPDEMLGVLLGGTKAVGDVKVRPTLVQVEWEHVNRVLDDCDGNITKAAKILGLHRRSLQRKLSKNPGKLS